MPGLQSINPLKQLRQPPVQHLQPPFIHVWRRRISDNELAGFDVRCDTRLAARFDAFADSKVPGHTGLTAKDNIIFHNSATRYANLGAQDAVFADDHVVGHLHEIINLGAFTDNRAAETSAIDRAVRADLDIVTNFNDANLGHLLMTTLHKLVAKAIGPNHHTGVQAHAVRQTALSSQHYPGHQPAIFSNAGIAAHKIPRLQMAVGTDYRSRLNHAQGTDRRRRVHFCTVVNHSTGMHTGNRLGPQLLLNSRANHPQRHGGVFTQQIQLTRPRLAVVIRRQKQDRSARLSDSLTILGIAQKTQIAGLRFFERSDAGDFGYEITTPPAGFYPGNQFVR